MKKKSIFFALFFFLFIVAATYSVSAETESRNYGLVDDGYRPAFPEESDTVSYSNFPSRYDPRDNGSVTPVKNQGDFGVCWSFSSIGTMEQVVYKQTGLKCDYSEEALRTALSSDVQRKIKSDKNTQEDIIPDLGLYKRNKFTSGVFYGAMQYLSRINSPLSKEISWISPNLESDIPYNEYAPYLNDAMCQKMNTSYANAYVTGVHYEKYLRSSNDTGYDENSNYYKNIQRIKNAIVEYGGMAMDFNSNQGDYLNWNTGAFFNKEYNLENAHEVVCVGWDDNYSKSNFNIGSQPNRDGAWLVKNSWGTSRGEKGFYWISYEDPTVCYVGTINIIDEVSKVSKNEKTLSYDYTPMYNLIPGRTLSPKENNAYMANVYNISNLTSTYDSINKITFYSSAIGANYDIHIVPLANGQGIDNVASYGESLASGSIDYEGIYTAHFDEDYIIPDGTYKIAVLVQFSNNNSVPIGIKYNAETNSDDENYTSCINPGESFYFDYNDKWKDLSGGKSSTEKGNFCIRPTLVRKIPITIDSTLSKYSRDYYGYNSVKVNINLNGNQLYKVTADGNELLYQDQDFTLSEHPDDSNILRVTLRESFFKDLNFRDSKNIVFEFTDGASQTLTVTYKRNVPASQINGNLYIGHTVSVILNDEPPLYYNDVEYQWLRSEDESTWHFIDGATDKDYTLTSDDIGCYLRVRVTAKPTGAYCYNQSRLSYISSNQVSINYGDINFDNIVNNDDLVLLTNYINNYITLSYEQQLTADVNKDGTIDGKDYVLLKNQLT